MVRWGRPTHFELGVIIHENGDDSDVWHKSGDDWKICQFVTDNISYSTQKLYNLCHWKLSSLLLA